jgi:hypothetical protein
VVLEWSNRRVKDTFNRIMHAEQSLVTDDVQPEYWVQMQFEFATVRKRGKKGGRQYYWDIER